MSKTRYILINGIHTLPSDKQAWTDRMAVWLSYLCGNCQSAFRLEYFTPFLMVTRSLINRRQRKKLVNQIRSAPADAVVVLVGHSNGCDIICDALGQLLNENAETLAGLPELRLVLVAGAVEHNFEKNYINSAMHVDLVSQCTVLASKNDRVLKWVARPSRWIFFRMGYGYLGYQAAVDVKSLKILFPKQVEVIIDDDQNHTSWLAQDKCFDETARVVCLTGKI